MVRSVLTCCITSDVDQYGTARPRTSSESGGIDDPGMHDRSCRKSENEMPSFRQVFSRPMKVSWHRRTSSLHVSPLTFRFFTKSRIGPFTAVGVQGDLGALRHPQLSRPIYAIAKMPDVSTPTEA